MYVIFVLCQKTALAMIEQNPQWTFLSNFGHVLICIAEDPEARLREIAARVEITERSTQRIINHLKETLILISRKNGRRNRYVINSNESLRHPIESHCTVANLLTAILGQQKVSKIKSRYPHSQRLKPALV